MAFHIRLAKHNLLKLTKFRALACATQTSDVHSDRHVYCFAENNHMTNRGSSESIQQDTYVDLKRRCYNPNSPKSFVCESSDSEISSIKKPSLEIIPDNTLDASPCSNSVPNTTELRDRVQAGYQYLPMSIFDLHCILFGKDVRGLKEDVTKCVSEIVKPVFYTEDDILANSNECRSRNNAQFENVSNSNIISHENHDVSFLQPVFSQLNYSTTNSASDDDSTLYCSKAKKHNSQGSPKGSGPSKEQLGIVEKYLAETLPKFLKERQDFQIFHKDIIFENNFWGKEIVTKGLQQYVLQINKMKILTHLKYAHAQMLVLNISTRPEDGTVRVRWRVTGLPQLKAVLFWRFMPWNYSKNLKANSEWNDGYSILTLGSDGLVKKHRLDRMMPDEEVIIAKPGGLSAKLALIIGLIPKPMDGLSGLFMKRSTLETK